MSDSSHDEGDLITGINITPLVDITLVILIAFIVTAQTNVRHAIPMDLPQATQSDEIQEILSVILQVNGPTLINGEEVLDDQGLQNIAALFAHDTSDARAVINADGDVPHKKVIHTLDILKQAGIVHVAFGISPTPENAP